MQKKRKEEKKEKNKKKSLKKKEKKKNDNIEDECPEETPNLTKDNDEFEYGVSSPTRFALRKILEAKEKELEELKSEKKKLTFENANLAGQNEIYKQRILNQKEKHQKDAYLRDVEQSKLLQEIEELEQDLEEVTNNLEKLKSVAKKALVELDCKNGGKALAFWVIELCISFKRYKMSCRACIMAIEECAIAFGVDISNVPHFSWVSRLYKCGTILHV